MAKKSAPRKSKSADADVETYIHPEAKRKNIPTAENQKLVADEDSAIKKLRWPRNPDLDPQLVWRGKDFEPDPLEVDVPPIYIQEKIQPRAIIEELRRQTRSRRPDATPQFDFFHDFNGLPEGWKEDATASYYHDEGNWSNRMILGDSLLVMASLAEREALRGKIQCIYMDPPYGIKFNSNWQPSTKSRDVREGKDDSVSREPEVIRAFRDTWKDGIHSYLGYLRDRLVAARDLLHPSGSLFVQIGDENLHIVRALLDEVFGSSNSVAIITVQKAGSTFSRYLGSTADYVLWYAVDTGKLKYHEIYRDRQITEDDSGRFTFVQLADGQRVSRAKLDAVPGDARLFAPDPLESAGMGREKGEGAASWFSVDVRGRPFTPSGQTRWKTNEIGMRRLLAADRILPQATRLRFAKFLNDFSVSSISNIWTDLAGAAEKIYVVQTAPKIVQRCILMTTDPGDLVFDPTCGSGTTAYVSEQWGRRWITVDTSRVALTLARARLMGAHYNYYLLRDSEDGARKEGELTGRPTGNGPFADNLRHGFVYERAAHVTLKSIVSNAEIDVIWDRSQKRLEPLREVLNTFLKQAWEEWQVPRDADDKWPDAAKAAHAQWWEARRARQKEIDNSIARNADVEYLYDRPYKARGVVRVAGPFTVESLSPHRVLPLGEDPYLAELLAADADLGGEAKEAKPARDEPASVVHTDFAQVVYENLKSAGVQNTKKGETLKFEWLKPFASRSGLIQFEGPLPRKGREQARRRLHRP